MQHLLKYTLDLKCIILQNRRIITQDVNVMTIVVEFLELAIKISNSQET